MKCIYCKRNITETTFKKPEHILPQAFGKFENNTVLRGMVCDECNQMFGNSIDRIIARDSIEGLERCKNKVIEDKKFKSEGVRSQLKAKSLEGFFKGALFYPDYDLKTNELRMFPLKNQVGIKRIIDDEFDILFVDEVPNKEDLSDIYKGEDGKYEIFADYSNTYIQKVLKEKGYLIEGDFIEYKFDISDFDNLEFEFSRTVDQNLGRAVAKIAFNYLAYSYGLSYALLENFNEIRDFIYNGSGNVNNFINK